MTLGELSDVTVKQGDSDQGILVDALRALIRDLSEDNKRLRNILTHHDNLYRQCMSMLESVGAGKPDSPYGNTLYGMVWEVTERLLGFGKARDQACDGAYEVDANIAPIQGSGKCDDPTT